MAVSVDLIRTIESRARRAWPAIHTEPFDGWELRFSRGFTRRANSIQPLAHSAAPILWKIDVCAGRYLAEGLPVRYRLTDASEPGLDAALGRHGYEVTAPVVTAITETPPDLSPPEGFEVTASPPEGWLGDQLVWSGRDSHHLQDLEELVAHMPSPAFATVTSADGLRAAVGFGVVDRGWLGLFGLATRPEDRGRGYGTRLVRGLERWGRSAGAAHSYLQVFEGNRRALALYRRLGFEPAYRYWYREPA